MTWDAPLAAAVATEPDPAAGASPIGVLKRLRAIMAGTLRSTAGGLAPGQALKTFTGRVALTPGAAQNVALWTVAAAKTGYITDVVITHDGNPKDTVAAFVEAVAPGALGIVAETGALPAGTYEVRVQVGFGATVAAGDKDNFRLRKSTPTTIELLPALAIANTFSGELVFPKVTVALNESIQVVAIGAASAGANYRARVAAQRLADALEYRIQAGGADIWRAIAQALAPVHEPSLETQPQANAGQAVQLVLPAGDGFVDFDVYAIEQ